MVLSFPVRCDDCDRLVAAPVAGSYDVGVDDTDELPYMTQYLTLRCPGCHKPFLLQRDGIADNPDWEYDEPIALYPRRRELDASVPKQIADSFNEAANCLATQAHTACAIMCRRTLEGICAHHNVGKGNLVAKLTKLRELGVIEQRLFDWADQLRIVGNEAAHDVAVVVPKADARDLVEFTRALVEYVFTFTEAFTKFRERRLSESSSRYARLSVAKKAEGAASAPATSSEEVVPEAT